jgi:hypothetical protein
MSCCFDCPYCGKPIDIIQGMELAAGNEWTALIQSIPPSMIGALLRYLELFKPKIQSLRWSRRLALTEELMPMIKSGTVQRNGITYAMPMQAWEAEMMKLVSNRPASLVLPLKTNGYLLSIMVGRVEKNLAAAEAKEIEAQRGRGFSPDYSGAQTTAKPNKPKSAPPQGWQGKAKRSI